jgi:hypothetical protein
LRFAEGVDREAGTEDERTAAYRAQCAKLDRDLERLAAKVISVFLSREAAVNERVASLVQDRLFQRPFDTEGYARTAFTFWKVSYLSRDDE